MKLKTASTTNHNVSHTRYYVSEEIGTSAAQEAG